MIVKTHRKFHMIANNHNKTYDLALLKSLISFHFINKSTMLASMMW